MPTYRVQVANHSATAVPADYFVNTLYFSGTGPTSDAAWQTFLGALTTAFQGNTSMAFSHYTVKAYNMGDAKPRPIIAQKITTGTDQTAGPTEVALCLSYFSGRNLPKLRGRIYVGPFGGTDTTVSRPDPTLITKLINLGTAIHAAAIASTLDWQVHSPTDNTYSPITDMWVDNAWDTQRRRGLSATVRNTAHFS